MINPSGLRIKAFFMLIPVTLGILGGMTLSFSPPQPAHAAALDTSPAVNCSQTGSLSGTGAEANPRGVLCKVNVQSGVLSQRA